MSKEYFNERTERLHFEITENFLNRNSVTEKAEELFEMLPKTDEDLKSLGVTEKDIEHYKKNHPLEQSEVTEGIKAYINIFTDYYMLYQIFILLQEKNKQNEILSLICKIMKLQSPEHDEIIKIIYENPSELMDINRLSFLSNPYEKTDMNRLVLFNYCFQKDDDYDKWVDSEIQEMIIAYFKHNHEPRDLFHTDHDYIQDYLTRCWFTEKKVSETEKKDTEENDSLSARLETSAYMLNPEALSAIPQEEKRIMFEKAKRKMQSLETMYSFRVIYPRKSYSDDQKEIYKIEMDLYDRVLFNKIKLLSNKPITYLEPEHFVGIFKNEIIKKQPLTKGVYMALYLAIKEMGWTQFQLLFPKIKTEYEKSYYINTIVSFRDFISNLKIGDDFISNLLDETKQNILIEELNPKTMSQTDRTFLKGLFFVCMWEKSSYRKPFDQDAEKNYKIVDYMSGDHIHRLFKDTPIENFHEVLKEATKLLEMSENGLDFSKFKLDDNFIYSEDIILTLYNFSRIEREAIPNLINIMNLIRERQKNILPIGSGNNFKEKNQNKLKDIDIGFNIPHFKRTLPPLENMNKLQWGDWDGRFIVTPVTCKFICETDRFFDKDGKTDHIAGNKKAIDSVYLYKIRNQATHYSYDENIYHLLKPKNIRQLLILLLEANKKYTGITELENKPLRIIAPMYATIKIEKLIQVLSMLLLILNKDILSTEEKKVFQFMLDDNKKESLKDLENYIIEQEKLGKEGIKLDADDYKNILSEEQMEEFIDNIILIYKFPSKEDLNRMPTEEQADMHHYIMNHTLDFPLLLKYINETIKSVLNFIFASHTVDYNERTQYDEFLKTYHGESSFYLLYLLQHFENGLKDN